MTNFWSINSKVVAVHTNVVKPRSADVNENILSEVARNKYGLTEEMIKNGQPLENVLEELDQFAKAKLSSETGRSFHLITDGQLHLRQVLHPEASNKGIPLPEYFNTFYDLRKEFRKFYRNNDIQTIDDIINYLCIEGDASADCAVQKVQNMAQIIIRLITDEVQNPNTQKSVLLTDVKIGIGEHRHSSRQFLIPMVIPADISD
ncbi:unnamed protein product [Oppiella nova]|uniref:Uncharacterized protein n=1 Tax=Oppiella nova TaxID=334625 RepID=A0A7R9L8Q7_9ACAR|nr:unnamed protein product [Oppiella nova]CAG2159392.1 unnamed protein product [Oppiella nova]